jgi:hypothetical protein
VLRDDTILSGEAVLRESEAEFRIPAAADDVADD